MWDEAIKISNEGKENQVACQILTHLADDTIYIGSRSTPEKSSKKTCTPATSLTFKPNSFRKVLERAERKQNVQWQASFNENFRHEYSTKISVRAKKDHFTKGARGRSVSVKAGTTGEVIYFGNQTDESHRLSVMWTGQTVPVSYKSDELLEPTSVRNKHEKYSKMWKRQTEKYGIR